MIKSVNKTEAWVVSPDPAEDESLSDDSVWISIESARHAGAGRDVHLVLPDGTRYQVSAADLKAAVENAANIGEQ